MTDLRMDSWAFMTRALADRQEDHDHLLAKDPLRLGWQCRVTGCRFFKPAEEFDGMVLVGGGSRDC